MVISSLHLNNVKSQCTIYRILNIPLGLTNTSFVAFYKISHEYIAVSLDHSRYILLSNSDAQVCIHNSLNLCAPEPPIYPKVNTKNCIASIFSDKFISQNCHTVIRTDISLRHAIHLSQGNWIVSLIKPFTMTVVCNKYNRKQIFLNPYFQIVKLSSGCYGFSDSLIIPSYFMKKHQVISITNLQL